jgi:putative GTP pyrophosphokinase
VVDLDNRRPIDLDTLGDLHHLREQFTRFMMQYKFGIDEVATKISILQEEFAHLHSYSPIEHVSTRLKSPVRQVKDYVAEPKPNGYRSLHALVEVPVHLSDRIVPVVVEVQLRTVAMDFWASLEHKIYYKFDADVPQEMIDELRQAAQTAADLDARMEDLHRQLHGAAGMHTGSTMGPVVPDDRVLAQLQTLRSQVGEG